ncbi:hypothetical protein Trydic_g16078 [Trypoxylus dichotomus]
MWLSYVDDTFVIWPHEEEEINAFLQHLNGFEESVKFTTELEVDNRIPFLDILVHKLSDGTLRTTVCKKPKHTGQNLHFESNHSHNVKLGVAECLYNRVRENRHRPKSFVIFTSSGEKQMLLLTVSDGYTVNNKGHKLDPCGTPQLIAPYQLILLPSSSINLCLF